MYHVPEHLTNMDDPLGQLIVGVSHVNKISETHVHCFRELFC